MQPRKMTYACPGLEVRLHPCADTPDHFKLELLTPYRGRYEYGDYPATEADKLAQQLIDSRRAWSPESPEPWRPHIWIWEMREWCTGYLEFWRRGPGGSELRVNQPHGRVWRMYWGILPVVRSAQDLGIFNNPMEAMSVLDVLAEGGMKGVLLD